MRLKRRLNNYAPLFSPERDTLYADYESYLRNELKTWGETILFAGQLPDQDIFNEEAIKSLWARHQSGLEEWTIGKLAPIMTYKMMLQKFYAV